MASDETANPETASVILAAVVREYDHEFARFRQIEQKAAILLTFSSGALVFLAARAMQGGPGADGLHLTVAEAPFLIGSLGCFFLSIVLALHSLWFRQFERLGFESILKKEELALPVHKVRRTLAKTYADTVTKNAGQIDIKMRSWKFGAGLGVAGLVLLVAQAAVG